MVISRAEIDDVNSFIGRVKRLSDDTPIWVPSTRPNEMQATWPIEDEHGGAAGVLKFRFTLDRRQFPSLLLIFRSNCVARLDIVPPHECKLNPGAAWKLGLPPRVCGTHYHDWANNAGHVELCGLWELPYRTPVEPSLRRVPQMLPWLADSVGIEISPEQRSFDVPPRGGLFEDE